jgi:hypothetical protein
MAERRPPGFVVPLGFYDGPEVASIPRRIRAAAVGVWVLCGTYSANKLLDGYVGPEMLRQLGCTPVIRAALMATKGPDGESDPLWIDARDGGIQFDKWVKYQRSRAEVKAYREAESERKRNARKATERTATSNDSETSARTSAGQRSEHRDPKTKTETKTVSTYVSEVDQTNVDAPERQPAAAATRGADIVRRTIPNGHPNATLTALRIQASELLHTGTDPDTVEQALRLWCDKPGVGIGRTILSSLCSEVIKSRTPQPRRNGTDTKGADWIRITTQLDTNHQPALEAGA